MTAEAGGLAQTVTESRFGAKRLYRDAGSMATSTVANALLGAAFWALAAKLFPPEQLGVMTAVLAVIIAAGPVLASGFGDAYTALLPAVGAARPRVYRRGQIAFGLSALVTGVGAAFATTGLLKEVRGSIGVGLMIAVGVFFWSAFVLQNTTLVALGRARWMPVVTIGANLSKILLLPLLALTLHWHSLELALVISSIVLVIVLRPMINRLVTSDKDLPKTAIMSEERALHEFNRLVPQTIAASLLGFGLLTITPFLVTMFSGPTQGALFALSLSVVQTLDFIGAAMAVSLVVHASSAPEQAYQMARAILLRAALLAAIGSVFIIAVVPTVLRLLNAQYGQMNATGVIGVLCASSVVHVVYLVWSALQKARRNLKTQLVFNAITAAILFAIMPSLARDHGAFGGAIAILIPQLVLCLGATTHFLVTRRRERGTATWGATAEVNPPT